MAVLADWINNMTKKDYELIALGVRDALEIDVYSTEQRKGVLMAVERLTAALFAANPGFNEDKFLQACGLED